MADENKKAEGSGVGTAPPMEPQPCTDQINIAVKALPPNNRDNPKMYLRAVMGILTGHIDALHRKVMILSQANIWMMDIIKAEKCPACDMIMEDLLRSGKCGWKGQTPAEGEADDEMCDWLRDRNPRVLAERRLEREQDGRAREQAEREGPEAAAT